MSKRWSSRYKRLVLEIAAELGNDSKAYREFNVSKSTFYEWRRIFRKEGAAGLIPKKPIVAQVTFHSKHTKIVRYDPDQDIRQREIESPYIPIDILDPAFPKSLIVEVEWR